MFPIHAALVCVNYADFLAVTLPANRALFKSITVATAPNDKATLELLRANPDVCHVVSDLATRDGAKFNKGKLLNVALRDIYARTSPEDWILVMDADVIVEPTITTIPEPPRRNMLYGVPRWFLERPEELEAVTVPGGYDWRLIRRLPNTEPLIGNGYFQLYQQRILYSEAYGTAAASDTEFRAFFLTGKHGIIKGPRAIVDAPALPGVICMHLGWRYHNWDGRKTKLWVPR